MEPGLSGGDIVIVDRVRTPAVGDIVVSRDPTTGRRIVKRVIAKGGDTVSWATGGPAAVNVVGRRGVPVPAGELFLAGDNHLSSTDSRVFGTVPEDGVEGVVLAVIWTHYANFGQAGILLGDDSYTYQRAAQCSSHTALAVGWW